MGSSAPGERIRSALVVSCFEVCSSTVRFSFRQPSATG
jgi:hypothetical protein